MITKLLIWTAASAALLTPLAYGTTVSFNVPSGGTFQGGAMGGLTLPSGDKSFSATFTSNDPSNVNVTASPTFFGAPGVALSQGSALGKFTFSDSTQSKSTNTGPIDLDMNVTVGSVSTTLTFVGNLVSAVSGSTDVLDINYTPEAGQFVETIFDPAYNVSGTYVMQYLNGYEFGVLESTLAESGEIDGGKQVGIDGVVSAAPEPGTLFSFGLTGVGLVAVGFKKRRLKSRN
ncbi:MAG TPA: PEP-CTERM sorting domain-containing protein [Bryobacteraceae bacterium]|jgi:hypothetical protein|nr:PEP-CTERM sorting domain-containing protein [Bryobacteraceae bacterium]